MKFAQICSGHGRGVTMKGMLTGGGYRNPVSCSVILYITSSTYLLKVDVVPCPEVVVECPHLQLKSLQLLLLWNIEK